MRAPDLPKEEHERLPYIKEKVVAMVAKLLGRPSEFTVHPRQNIRRAVVREGLEVLLPPIEVCIHGIYCT